MFSANDFSALQEDVIGKVFDDFNPEVYLGLTISEMSTELILKAAETIIDRRDSNEEKDN